MADVDPNSIPFLLGKQDRIADENGKPTTPMLDWLQGLWSWMKQSVVDLTTKITTLEFTAGDLQAQITEEATIRETEDGIIASSVTSLTATVSSNTAAITAEATTRATNDSAISAVANSAQATANNATASSQVYWAAKAAPAGSTAAFGVFLTAGNAYGGLEIVAQSGGGSAIGMTANQFFFRDSGSQFYPFSYSGGTIFLNGNVVFQAGNSSGTTIITGSLIQVFDASNQLRFRAGVW